MTKQEFIAERQARASQISKRLQVTLLVISWGGLFVLPILTFQPAWLCSVGGLLCFIVIASRRPLIRWYIGKRFGVPCPQCGKPLIGNDADIALFSGTCWYCHKKIFTA